MKNPKKSNILDTIEEKGKRERNEPWGQCWNDEWGKVRSQDPWECSSICRDHALLFRRVKLLLPPTSTSASDFPFRRFCISLLYGFREPYFGVTSHCRALGSALSSRGSLRKKTVLSHSRLALLQIYIHTFRSTSRYCSLTHYIYNF